MHLAIDAVGNHTGGGLRVLHRVLDAVQDTKHISNVTLWCSDEPLLLANLNARPSHWRIEPVSTSLFFRPHWHQTVLNQRVRHVQPDVVLSLNGMGNVTGVRHVVFVQQPLIFSPVGLSTMPWPFIARMISIGVLTQVACQKASCVVVQTPTMARHIQQRIDHTRIKVLTPDAPYMPEVLHDRAQNHRLLYVGHEAPYKNMSTLYKAMNHVVKTLPNATLSVTHEAPHQPKHAPWLRVLGPQPPDHIATLMKQANALIMPSLAETVGLPLIEAMASSLPILAADLPYAHDICGDAASFFNPRDARQLADKIIDLLTTPTLSTTLQHRGLRRARALAQQQPYLLLMRLLGG